MGLDMYLSKRTYVKNWNFQKDEEKHKVTVKFNGKSRKDIKPKRISHIIEEVGYWRKANHIHSWFVENIQDGRDECQESYVSLERLTELRDLCKEVVKYKNSEFNNDNLPTSSGFFFGSTEYGEYYYEDCKDTIKILNTILKDEEIIRDTKGIYSSEYYYQASW
tara:strand:- start:75 stop:566 length:492 start_codon:yes stop_codon:yes gene_type:complete